MPLLTTLPMLLVGMSVAEWQPGLPLAESESVVIAVKPVPGASLLEVHSGIWGLVANLGVLFL